MRARAVIVSKSCLLARLALGLFIMSGAVVSHAADVKVGLGHYTTHLRAGGEREPPAPMPRAGVPQRPVPTNQWYSSLLFERWSQPLYAQPGSYRASEDGFHIDQPKPEASLAGSRDENDIVAMHRSVLTVKPDFPLEHARAGKTSDWAVDVVTGNSADAMTVTLAHGSPYSFHRLSSGDASFGSEQPLQMFSRSADGRAVGVVAEGKPFGLYAPAGSRWETLPDGRLKLVLPEGRRFFSVAVLPARTDAALAQFHRHAYAFLTDTRVDFVYNEKRSEVTTTFSVKTEVKEGTEAGTVFGLYPHQWHRNELLPPQLPYQYDTIRGPLKLVTGRSFQTRYRYTGILPHWPALRDPAEAAQLQEFVASDTRFGAESLLGNRGTYWEGKGFNRALQVMTIAEQQGDLVRRDAILAAMKKRFEQWFAPEPGAERYFHYNANVGSLTGYPDEYGSAQELNDHHFHYGYWIQGAAQIALRDPAWAAPDQWGGMVGMLVADIATTDRADTRFPRLRNFDPYEGHAWAAGLAQFYDGNNQESSSEAINAWAALILWAEATGNKALRDTGIYLYTTEIEATNHYWFDLHRLVFPKDYQNTLAGIVWGNKYVHNTWWTEDPREIHGINVLPVTTASLYLARDPDYIERNLEAMDREFKQFRKRGGQAPADIWQDVLLSHKALADPAAAMAEWNPKGAVEDGETRSHTFHWIRSLVQTGRPRLDVTADTPLFAVFRRPDGVSTYLAYNAGTSTRVVTFSDGTVMRVAPRSLGSHQAAKAAIKGR